MSALMRYVAKDADGTVHLDKFALFDQQVMAVSFACSTVQAKAVAALLQTEITMNIEFAGVPWDWGNGEPTERYFNRLGKAQGGYRVWRCKLDKWTAHIVAVAKDERLLLSADQQGLLARLLSPRYTTPILSSWIGEIETALRERRALVDCTNYGLRAGMIAAKDEHLDMIVGELLRKRAVVIN